jgi:hypothetical protein
MKRILGLAVASVLATASAAAAAPMLKIERTVARLVVVPESRSDIVVQIINANPKLPMQVRTEGGRTLVSGPLKARGPRSCLTTDDHIHVEIFGLGGFSEKTMPVLVVRTPMDVHIDTSGAVFGVTGRARSLSLSSSGCGDWTLANVETDLVIDSSGSGDIRAGKAGSLDANIAGSGDLDVREVLGKLSIDSAGSGDVSVGSISGPVDLSSAGSGNIDIKKGTAPSMAISTAGSGDIAFSGTAGSLQVSTVGSGDVSVFRATGPVAKSSAGSGSIEIGGR